MSINRWINKQNAVYTYSEMLFSHKSNEVLIHATTFMNLENLYHMKCQTQKDKYFVTTYIKCIE